VRYNDPPEIGYGIQKEALSMPVYTYRCTNCEVQFEKQQSFSDEPLSRCPECGKKTLKKVYMPVGIVFKGSGFYATDHHSPSGQRHKKDEKDGRDSRESSEKKDPAPTTDKPAEKKDSTPGKDVPAAAKNGSDKKE
jgi:putative FmdB family regulatory protein